MSDEHPVTLSSGLPETVLDLDPPEALDALAAALEEPGERRSEAVAAVALRWPRCLDAWAQLGLLAQARAEGSDQRQARLAEAYACFRVGYHRGLDRLRQCGWRGSGYVRWRHPANRGFLRALSGLGRTAGVIGETEEERRCAEFVRQLDPEWDGADR
jgi:hypothetical protein